MAEILTQEQFLERALIHNKTNISLEDSVYVSTRSKVIVKCTECSYTWDILPKALFRRCVKCPSCNRSDRISSNYVEGSMTLYFLKITTGMVAQGEPEYIYKVGITKYVTMSRFPKEDLRKIEVLKEISFDSGKKCHEAEQAIHKKMEQYKYKGNFRLSSGNTELLTINPIEFLMGG